MENQRISIRTGHFLAGDVAERSPARCGEVLRGEFDLDTEMTAADDDLRVVLCSFGDEDRVLLLHADRGTAAADIAGHTVDIFDMNHGKRFDAGLMRTFLPIRFWQP